MFSLCRHLSAIRFQLILAFSATPIDFLFVYKTNEYYNVFRFFLNQEPGSLDIHRETNQ